jgi:hypothetical protein
VSALVLECATVGIKYGLQKPSRNQANFAFWDWNLMCPVNLHCQDVLADFLAIPLQIWEFRNPNVSTCHWNIPVIKIDIFAIYKSLSWDYLLNRKISADSKQC